MPFCAIVDELQRMYIADTKSEGSSATSSENQHIEERWIDSWQHLLFEVEDGRKAKLP